MSANKKQINELYSKSDELFLQLSAYFKKLMHDHKINNHVSVDQRKILKLFNFQSWDDFVLWIHQKLEEGGEQQEQGQKNVLPEIVEEEADLQESVSEDHPLDQNVQCQFLAIQNAKLRKENIILQDKIETLQKQLFKESQIVNK